MNQLAQKSQPLSREEQAFHAAVMSHRDPLLKYCLSLTKNKERAEDLRQDTLVKALEKRHQFIPGTNLRSWMFTIAKNLFLSIMRSSVNQKETNDTDGIHAGNVITTNNPETQLAAKQSLKMLDALPEVKRKMLLEIAEGSSYEEVAKENNVAAGTVKSSISRSRDELENLLNGKPQVNHEKEREVELDLGDKISRYRKVIPFERLGLELNPVVEKAPYFMLIDPKKLLIEESYQRSITKKSRTFIRKIIADWDWSKFKAPNCATDGTNIFIIDGQHTSIAAASHPSIDEIPILIMPINDIVRRAKAFVSLNRNRVAMSAMDIFHAATNATDSTEFALKEMATRLGGKFPKYIPLKVNWKPYVLSAAREWIRLYKRRGVNSTEAVMKVVLDSKCPLPTQYLIRSVDALINSQAGQIKPFMVLAALQAHPDIDEEGNKYSVLNNVPRSDAITTILYNDIRKREGLE